MKRLLFLFAVVGITTLTGCNGEDGPQGPAGPEAEVFELKNVNFTLNADGNFTIFRNLNPLILPSDNILIYRMSDLINSTTPVWQLIPRTLYLPQGELDYYFDFSKQDFTIYADGNYNLTITPQYLNNVTFRIVIVPGYFGRMSKPFDYQNYSEVIKFFDINDKNPIQIK